MSFLDLVCPQVGTERYAEELRVEHHRGPPGSVVCSSACWSKGFPQSM